MTSSPRTMLTAPRATVESEINGQIEASRPFQEEEAATPDEFGNLRSRFEAWNRFNQQLLRERFTTLDLFNQYRATYSRTWPTSVSVPEMVLDLRARVAAKLEQLGSTIAQLRLFEEVSIPSTTVEADSGAPDRRQVFVIHGRD